MKLLRLKFFKLGYILIVFILTNVMDSYSQELTGYRVRGSKYVSLIGGANTDGGIVGVGFEKFLRSKLIFNTSILSEISKFEYSDYRTYIATAGLSYSLKISKSIFIEGRGETFVGLENEIDDVSNYKGFYFGFILSPELEFHLTQKLSLSLMYNQYIDVVSKVSELHQNIGLKLNIKL